LLTGSHSDDYLRHSSQIRFNRNWLKTLWVSKSHGHADMAARKAEPLVKSLRIDTGVMRQQFDQLAPLGAGFRYRPLHHLLAVAAAARVFGDADIFDQAARGALRTQPRQDAELQAADHGALAVLGNDEEDIRIACEPIERREIGLRQRVFDRSRAPPSGSSASMATMTLTSSRRVRRMVTSEMADMIISGVVSALAGA